MKSILAIIALLLLLMPAGCRKASDEPIDTLQLKIDSMYARLAVVTERYGEPDVKEVIEYVDCFDSTGQHERPKLLNAYLNSPDREFCRFTWHNIDSAGSDLVLYGSFRYTIKPIDPLTQKLIWDYYMFWGYQTTDTTRIDENVFQQSSYRDSSLYVFSVSEPKNPYQKN